jgi:hypothetical protein
MKNREEPKDKVITCARGAADHQILVRFDSGFDGNEEGDTRTYKEVYLQPYLITHKNFFSRLWWGLRYAFGYRSRLGSWDDIIITHHNIQTLKEVVEWIEKTKI